MRPQRGSGSPIRRRCRPGRSGPARPPTRRASCCDRLLVVADEALLEQDLLLEPGVEATLDDLGPRLLGLALGLGDVEQRLALLLDRVGVDLVTGEVRRLGEGDVHADVVGQLLGAALELDEHGVDAAPVLQVQVRVEDVAVGGLEADDLAELDVLLLGDLEVVDLLGALADGVDALGGDDVGEVAGRASTKSSDLAEKSVSHLSSTMAPTLPSTTSGDRALAVLAVGELGRPWPGPSRAATGRRPRSRRRSPVRAFFASIIPAPVAWRRAWTSLAVKSDMAQGSWGVSVVGGCRSSRRPRPRPASASASEVLDVGLGEGGLADGRGHRPARRSRRPAAGRARPAARPSRRRCGPRAAAACAAAWRRASACWAAISASCSAVRSAGPSGHRRRPSRHGGTR